MGRVLGNPTRPTETGRLVIGAGLLMILAQLVFRAWALYPSWFFLDDYNLLHDATFKSLDWDYLLTPYNSHLMPGGRLLAWIVADSGTLNWTLAATLTLGLQALANAGALWMVVRLFGARWAALIPLSLYLFTSITVPAAMWWAAALNQLPHQVAFFAAITCWVSYLRGRNGWWLAATMCAVGLGVFFDVKALLIFPVLAFLALAYFSAGSLSGRLRSAVVRYWPAVLVGSLAAGGYLAYYLMNVQQPFTEPGSSVAAEILDSMVGTAFATGVVGGPWTWAVLAPPTAFAAPPAWTVHLSWVVIVLVILYGALRRHATMRAWALLGGYVLALVALLVNSRAPSFAETIGLDYRYLTDAACCVALCLGLAFMPLLGATQSSSPRLEPLLRLRVPAGGWVAGVLLISVSGLVSSAQYIAYWHSDNASDAYVQNLAADLRTHGAVDLADATVPDDVLSQLTAPDNTVRRLVSLISQRPSFPESTPQLVAVAADGTLRQALISPGVQSTPGPKPDCGWLVKKPGREIELTGRAFPWEWWVRIGYLASQDSPVEVRAGSDRVSATVEAGLNNLYVKVDGGAFDTVTIEGLDAGATMCVDTIEVGQPVPGGRLS